MKSTSIMINNYDIMSSIRIVGVVFKGFQFFIKLDTEENISILFEINLDGDHLEVIIEF